MQRRQFLRVSTLSVVALTTGGCALRRGFDSGLRIAVHTPWLAWPGQGQQVIVQASLWTEFVPSSFASSNPLTRDVELSVRLSSGVVLIQPLTQTQFQLASHVPQQFAFIIHFQDVGKKEIVLNVADIGPPRNDMYATLVLLDVGRHWTNVRQEDVAGWS